VASIGAPQTKPHYASLDGLRAAAVLLVLCGHTPFGGYHPKELAGLGVHLFFVLSGFLITALLMREQAISGRIDLKAFITRRVLRIFPAYYTFLCLTALAATLGWASDVPWHSWVAASLFVSNIWGRGYALGQTWSLSLEEQFYLLWPGLLYLLGRRDWQVRAAGAGILLVSLLRIVALASGWSDDSLGQTYMRPWFRFDSLLLGGWLAMILAPQGRLEVENRLTRKISLLWVLPALLAWTLYGESSSLGRVVFLSVQAGLIGACLIGLLRLQTNAFWRRVFESRGVKTLAILSYPIYLWHRFSRELGSDTPRCVGVLLFGGTTGIEMERATHSASVGAISTSKTPVSTACPSFTQILVTLPANVLRISFSIFMASITSSGAPLSISSPTLATILTILPGILA